MDIEIRNTQECFVALWRELERTRRDFWMRGRRFCVRRIVQSWLGPEATDDFIWEVCEQASSYLEEPLYGYDLLPRPTLFPQRSREFLRALVATKLGISIRDVRLGPLNAAFSIAFPQCTAINTEKKKKQHTSKRGRKKKPP